MGRRISIAGAPVGEVAALGIGDARIGPEGRGLAAPCQLDLVFGGEVVTRRVGEVEGRDLPGERRCVRQAAQLVRRRDSGQGYGLVHQALDGGSREVRRRGGGGRLAGKDAQGEVLRARVLDRVHAPEPDLGGKRPILDEEGVGRGRSPLARSLQHVSEQVEHA